MTSMNASHVPVNPSEHMNLTAISKEAVAVYRAAQVLADALGCRAGTGPRGLSTMTAEERTWHLDTTRNLIDLHRQMVGGAACGSTERTAGGGGSAVTVAGSVPSPKVLKLIARQQARDSASERGHSMGLFMFASDTGGGYDESACTRCGRSVLIDAEMVISGPALDEGCITEADRG